MTDHSAKIRNCRTLGELYRALYQHLDALKLPAADHALQILEQVSPTLTSITAVQQCWEDAVTGDELSSVAQILERLHQAEPLAYILGHTYFHGLRIQVDHNTLIPRPDSEILVETVLSICPQNTLTIAELGTGTGALAVALACARPNWIITASDISSAALEVAKLNVAAHGRDDQIRLQQRDWLAGSTEKFDAILSNPPYIPEDDPHLEDPSLRFEPQLALVAKKSGADAIEKIISQGRHHLHKGAPLFLEHGYDQGTMVRRCFEECDYRGVTTVQDLAGRDRVTYGISREPV